MLFGRRRSTAPPADADAFTAEADSERLDLIAEQGGDGLSAEPDTPEALLIRAAMRDNLR